MSGDSQYSNLPLISSFLKHFSRAFLGPQPVDGQPVDGQRADDTGEALPHDTEELVFPEVQKKMRELFASYFETASKTLVKGQIVRFHFQSRHSV